METRDARRSVVVGGASGIGAAVVDHQRRAGLTVVSWDVRGDSDVECDVADPASVEWAIEETLGRIGVPELVTVTAGVGHSATLLDVTPDEWDRVMRVNTRGPMLVMRGFARAMIDAGVPGSIIATSSVSARLADPTMGTYCASKAALSMVVAVAAAEWGRHRIRVNAVGPGVTNTPMLGGAPEESKWLTAVARRTPLGRIGQADDIAEVVASLHELGWVTGQVVECDGGLAGHSPIDPMGLG